jgi:hypothetical protein
MSTSPAGTAVAVDVLWNGLTLARAVPLAEVTADGAFLASDAPMPVGTRLRLSSPGAPEIEVWVASVIEGSAQATDAPSRQSGMRLAFVRRPEAGGEEAAFAVENAGEPASGELASGEFAIAEASGLETASGEAGTGDLAAGEGAGGDAAGGKGKRRRKKPARAPAT